MSARPVPPVQSDVVGEWKIHLPDGIHTVQFEHGATTGKRVVRVDGEEVLRKNWMFNLIGSENFKVSNQSATITIESEILAFVYSIEVGGKSLEQFVKAQNKQNRTWYAVLNGEEHRIVIDTKTLEVYVDGQKTDTVGEFVEDGAENHFQVGSHPAFIKTISSGNRRKGLLYKLNICGREFDPIAERIE